jgi:translation initiation factor 3 subunit G
MHMRAGAKPTEASASAPGGGKGERRDDPNTIRISNLSEDTTDADVRALVNPFGSVSRVFVAMDRDYGGCKGYAFVTFFERSRAEACIAKLDGYGYDSLILKVDFAR